MDFPIDKNAYCTQANLCAFLVSVRLPLAAAQRNFISFPIQFPPVASYFSSAAPGARITYVSQ